MRGLQPGDKCFVMYQGYEEELEIVRGFKVRGGRYSDVSYNVQFKRPHLKQHNCITAEGDYVGVQMSCKNGKLQLDWRTWRVVRSPVETIRS